MSRSQPNIRVRWFRFSLVGALGIAVQLGVLRLWTGAHVHYLLATALAVEAAVLHNFIWHERYTWKERGNSPDPGPVLGRLARFHAANALVSLAGNLLLMRLLVGEVGIPVLPANVASIASCWVANFLISDRWVFLRAGVSPRPLQAPIRHQH